MASQKLPTGITLRGGSIVIDFRFRGQRCRETIKNLEATKTNIKWAERKRAAILHEIAQGTFDYADHFPESRNATLFSGPKAQKKTVNEALDEWLTIMQPQISKSSYRTYRNRAGHHLRPYFGEMQVASLTRTTIELWRTKAMKKLANKTVNEAMLGLRAVLQNAKADRLIDYNPMEDIDNLPIHYDEPDPFTQEEIERILTTPTHYQQEINMMRFAFWTGVRLSELIALAWEDVDWTRKTVKVQRALVDKSYKVPKTKRSVRTLELTAPAIDALEAQRLHTEMLAAKRTPVTQSDNRTVRHNDLRIVFMRTMLESPFPKDDAVRDQFWINHLKKAKVRYRGPNHARHTFVSQMLTAGMPKDWIAYQCGHTSTNMIDKHYGRWIPDEAPNMASLVNAKFGFTKDEWSHDGHKESKE